MHTLEIEDLASLLLCKHSLAKHGVKQGGAFRTAVEEINGRLEDCCDGLRAKEERRTMPAGTGRKQQKASSTSSSSVNLRPSTEYGRGVGSYLCCDYATPERDTNLFCQYNLLDKVRGSTICGPYYARQGAKEKLLSEGMVLGRLLSSRMHSPVVARLVTDQGEVL